MARFIGLMSGTSLDGVDAVLASTDDAAQQPGTGAGADATGPRWQVSHHVHQPFAAELRDTLLALNTPGDNELHRAALAGNGLARAYADAVAALLIAAGCSPADIAAVGAHGQTVRHRPGEFDGTGYTLQLLNGALLAELCGIEVVCDLRSRDVAAGGQGAPLVPAFHDALFRSDHESLAVLNIGGIANLSLLPALAPTRGFDCGPGNVLLDAWCARHTGQPFDQHGQWAAGGQVDAGLLARLLDEPFLKRSPPKSTGRDLFHTAWLEQRLTADGARLDPQNVQATLTEFTARAAADALAAHLPDARRLLVCGGGSFNRTLMQRLAALLPSTKVADTGTAGLPAMQVEAAAFAWLAAAALRGAPGNLAAVTGARGPRVLGARYPAG